MFLSGEHAMLPERGAAATWKGTQLLAKTWAGMAPKDGGISEALPLR
jgi:hypothetical protein